MPKILLRILAESVIQVGEQNVAPNATHLFALLLYLGVERGRSVARAELATMLFPDENSSASAHNLRQLLYRARRLGVPLTGTASTICISSDAVEDSIQEALAGRSPTRVMDSGSTYTLLPHYSPPTAPLSRWLEALRERVNHQLLRRLSHDMHSARKRADWLTVATLAQASLDLDPFNETAMLLRAEALALTGSKQQAVSMLRRFEHDVGRSSESLALPSRLLKRRISEFSALRDDVPNTLLIGRSDEMRRLSSIWESVRAGQWATVIVTGEKSIGKTRLVSDFLSTIRLDGSGAVLSTRRLPADRRRPMSLFADICKQLICIPGAAGCSPTHISFLTRLTAAPDGLSSLRAQEFEHQYSQGGVRHAIIDLFECVSSEQPIVCHIDDADYLDDASLDILSVLRDHLSAAPVLTLLSVRSPRAVPAQDAHTVRIRPLDASSAKSLAIAIKNRGNYALTESVLDWCVSTALGNPGHLELLVAHAANAAKPPDVPLDLVALTDARLSTLPTVALNALQACAVFGVECRPSVVSALTGLTQYRLLTALQALEESSLLHATQDGLRCSSELVEERVRASTPDLVRRLLHERAARYLEDVNKTCPPTQALAWRTAEHFDQAGESDAALQWRRIYWRQLISIGQPMDAARSIRGQLIAAHRPDVRGALLDVLIDALHAAGETIALLDTLHERSALSSFIGDSRSVRSALAFDIAEASTLNYADPTPYYKSLKQQLRSGDLDPSRRSRASRILMIAADNAVDPDFAREVYLLHDAVSPEDSSSAILHHHARLIYHSVFGDRTQARACADALEALTLEGECSWARISSICNVAFTRRMVDEIPPNYTRLEQSFEECRSAGMDNLALLISSRIATFLFEDGLVEAAVEWGRRSRRLADLLQVERHSGDYITSQIDLALVTGRLSRAQSLVETIPCTWSVSAQPRLSKEFLVYQSRVLQFCGDERGTDESLEQLLNWHKRARHYSRHDDHVEVLWVALSARGRGEEASGMLREYLSGARRELRPCNYLLRTRTAADPVWDSLPVTVASKLDMP